MACVNSKGCSVTTRLRITRALHDRAKICADAIHEPLTEFVRCCLIQQRKGTFAAVVNDTELQSTTDPTAVITIQATDLEPPEIRRAIANGVMYSEARMPSPFKTHLVAGRDYFIDTRES